MGDSVYLVLREGYGNFTPFRSEMNIPPDKPGRPAGLNDLSAAGNTDSMDENASVTNQQNGGQSTAQLRRQEKKPKRRRTLSIYAKDLEEARRQIAAEIESKVSDGGAPSDTNSVNNKEQVQNDTKGTAAVSNINSDNHGKQKKPETLYRYVQEGERNLMLITEPLETSKGVYYKQVGNKNVMVHLNLSSNLCQLLDPEDKGIIPLDNKGEVWLEIKIRGQNVAETSTMSSSSESTDLTFISDSTCRKKCQGQHNQQCDNYDCQRNITERKRLSSGSENANSLNKDFDACFFHEKLREPCENSDWSSAYDNAVRQARRRSAGEHMDSSETNVVDENLEGGYSTISIFEKSHSLIMKFEKGTQSCTLDKTKILDSPLMSHRKVIEFLTNQGNNFDVSICDWEYQTESVYSYISKIRIAKFDPDGYDRVREEGPELRPLFPAEHPQSTGFSVTGEPVTSRRHDSGLPDRPPQPLPRHSVERSFSTSILDCNTSSVPQRGEVDEVKRMPSPPLGRSNSDETLVKKKLPGLPPRTVQELVSASPGKSNEGRNRGKHLHTRLPPPPGQDPLLKFIWYHGNIEKAVARKRLEGQPHGSFLVRKSTGSEPSHMYTIELIDEGRVKKLMIMRTNSQYHFKEFERQRFNTVEELIETIVRSGLEVKETRTGHWKTITVTAVPKR